jgi:hypothetical protein
MNHISHHNDSLFLCQGAGLGHLCSFKISICCARTILYGLWPTGYTESVFKISFNACPNVEWNIGDAQHSSRHRRATDAEMQQYLGQMGSEMDWKDVTTFLYQFSRNSFDLDKFHKKIL